MNSRLSISAAGILAILLSSRAGGFAQANSAQVDAGQLFTDRIQPLLTAKCFPCHGEKPDKIKSGLDLRTRAGMIKGGDSGLPAIRPGHPDTSRLWIGVTRTNEDFQMPPKENDKLSAEQVEWIWQWIAGGAPWADAPLVQTPAVTKSPGWDTNYADGVRVKTSGGLADDWNNRKYKPEDLWAYQPITRPTVPTNLVDPVRVQNPIDAFIQEKLKARGVVGLAPPADRRILLRRATFDLTGLPPRPEDLEAFLQDHSAGAWSHWVARLLASPCYGEQQARYWLDVVRYADTSGFSNDFERPNAWRYRDYVIRSFNLDKPYDRFMIEQLAGDELDPGNPELLVAAGFLRMGPWEHTAMTVAAVTRQQFLDDVTHNVGVSLLGQSLRCARCHDHKFDPLPTRDYYRIQAVFASTQFAERPAPFLPAENVQPNSSARAGLRRELEEVNRGLEEMTRKNQEAIAAYLKEKGVARLEDAPRDDRVNKDGLGLTRQELTVRKVYQKQKEYLERELERYEPSAFSVYAGGTNNYTSDKPLRRAPARLQGTVPATHILTGGALESPADEVTPGVLSAMFDSNDGALRAAWNTIPQTAEGRRLAFARWVASDHNTLTARVIVNRAWQQHFGRGLAAAANNFGKMGGHPSHPELLDWLATWFIEHGWSIKQLHALIMTSATYQQAGESPEYEKLKDLDPKNELLACFAPRRLAAEEIRDTMLAVSGELNLTAGGPGVFPEINWEVAFQPRQIMGSVAPAYQPSPTPEERNRRTIYTFRTRTLADPVLEVFNRPGTDISCERRDETTVTPQVFALFNSEFAHHRALAFAAALQKRASRLPDQIQAAFRLTYGREAAPEEILAATAHVARMTEYHRQHAPAETKLPTSVQRSMVEEMTGETATWEESLENLKHYQPDLMPWQTGPETRALADLCLVLLNSNEFLYLR